MKINIPINTSTNNIDYNDNIKKQEKNIKEINDKKEPKIEDTNPVEERKSKIEEIKKQIENGTYKIDIESTAKKISEELL